MQEVSKDEQHFNFKAQGFIKTYTSTLAHLCTDRDGSYLYDTFCERIQLHYNSCGLLIKVLQDAGSTRKECQRSCKVHI